MDITPSASAAHRGTDRHGPEEFQWLCRWTSSTPRDIVKESVDVDIKKEEGKLHSRTFKSFVHFRMKRMFLYSPVRDLLQLLVSGLVRLLQVGLHSSSVDLIYILYVLRYAQKAPPGY